MKRPIATPYSLRALGPGYRLSPHFTLGEFRSKCGSDVVLIHPHLIALLEQIRSHYQSPITIQSGYRTREHNKKVGGAADSQHIHGRAADIVVSGIPALKVFEHLKKNAKSYPLLGGLGKYETFTHIDVRPKSKNKIAIWGE